MARRVQVVSPVDGTVYAERPVADEAAIASGCAEPRACNAAGNVLRAAAINGDSSRAQIA